MVHTLQSTSFSYSVCFCISLLCQMECKLHVCMIMLKVVVADVMLVYKMSSSDEVIHNLVLLSQVQQNIRMI